jgi:4-amino-4-deoxy-L-arabinose transferase-like glycosyltransferase
VAALLIGAGGEALLGQEAQRGLGAGLLVLAAVLGVAAWGGLPVAPLLPAATARPWWRVAWRRALLGRLIGIAGAVGLAWAAVAAYLRDPAAIFGLQGWLWLASMGLLIAACARWYPRDQPDPALDPPWTQGERALFLALVALALLTHVAFLDAIPWRFHFDEGFAFTEVMRYYRGPMIPLFTTTWHDTGLPSLLFAYEAGLMRLLGPGLGSERLGVALIGALLVVPVYGLARLAWSRTAAALAAFFVAVSAAAIHYSRVSILNMTTAFWWAVCFYFLLRGLYSRRPGDFVWAGLAAGTSMYTYYGTRLLPYLLAAFAAYLLVFHWRVARERLGHFALVGIGFLAGFGPLLGYFLQYPQMWVSRGLSIMNVPAQIPATWAGWMSDWQILAPLAWRNFLGLSVEPGRDLVYFAPLLLPAEAVLLVLGLALLIRRWRQPAAFLLLLAAGGVVLTGGTLLDATTIPNFAHWTPAFAVIYLALALPLALCLQALHRMPRRVWLVSGAMLAIALVADAGANLYSYLIVYPPRVPPDRSLEALQGRYLASIGDQARVRIAGVTWQPFNPEIAALLSPQTPAGDLLNPSRELPLPGDPAHDLAFVFYNDQEPLLPVVQAYYPGGQMTALQTPDGNHVATAYRVPAAQAGALYGVQAEMRAAHIVNRVEWSGLLPAFGALPPDTLAYPVIATWSGAVYVPGGSVRVQVVGDPAAPVWVQGQPVGPDTPMAVEPGWVRIALQAQLTGPRPLQLLLQAGADPPAEIPAARLWPAPPNQGLAVTLSGPGGPVHRIDPFVSARVVQVGASHDPAPLSAGLATGGTTGVRWTGEVATGAGTYTMILHGDARVQLWIDGQLVVNGCSPASEAREVSGPVALTAGWHRVRLDLQPGGGTGGVEWHWVRPDGVREVVPPGALRIGPDARPTAPIAWPDPPGPVICP